MRLVGKEIVWTGKAIASARIQALCNITDAACNVPNMLHDVHRICERKGFRLHKRLCCGVNHSRQAPQRIRPLQDHSPHPIEVRETRAERFQRGYEKPLPNKLTTQ